MNYAVFEQGLEKIYAVFGKTYPKALAVSAIWERLEKFPDVFMSWAVKEILDLDSMPGNLGKYLEKTLWPEWRRAHPEHRINLQETCPDCRLKADLPGNGFWAWDEGYQVFCACRCSGQSTVYTKEDMKKRGYTVIPYDFTGSYSAWMRKMEGHPAANPAPVPPAMPWDDLAGGFARAAQF